MPNDMLELLLRDLSPTEINAFAREIQTPADYALTQSVMPERTINSVRWEHRGTRRRVAAASYRAWDAQTKVATREITQFATSGKLLPLGQKYIVGEFETILENLDRGMDSRDLVQAVYDDVAAHVLSIKKRLELAVGDLLVDGKFSLVGENGLTLEADYAVPAANMPTASTRALTSYKTAALMMGNDSYRAAYYGSVNSASTIPTAVLAPNEVNVVRARYNLPPITTYDVKIELDTGSDVRALPENMFFLLPPNPQQWAETQYGLTADGLILSQGGNPAIEREEAPGIVVTRGYQDDPPQVWTKGSAAALPVMYVPDIHIAATVW
jgi:hypothetical protein